VFSGSAGVAYNNKRDYAAIALPESDGRIKAIRETFHINLSTGTGNFSRYIATSPVHPGFRPLLSRHKSTVNYNGVWWKKPPELRYQILKFCRGCRSNFYTTSASHVPQALHPYQDLDKLTFAVHLGVGLSASA